MTETRSCPRCYAPLRPSESPEGLCPKCLLAVAMGEDGLIRTATGEPVPAPPAIADLAPHFPQLEILSLVGRGGAGAVYRAIQRDLGRTVALKVLLLDPERDPTFGERFAREARAMASLTHPNIAAVHDAGRAGPYWYLLLELIDGPNLRQLIQARDLPPSEALDVVRQVCSALEYAHEEGVVHRDIKPENVLVDARGKVKLVDFGLAKLLRPELSSATLTGSAQAMGTWHYMAPEQLRRPLEVDHRADIYSLGVVLYELLTGEIPQGRYEPASHRAHTDRRLDAIVDRALEQDPARRYQQASGVREDVERVSSGPAVDPPRPARHARHERRSWFTDPARRHERGQTILYGCGCLLLAAMVLMLGSAFLVAGSHEESGATITPKAALPANVSPGAQRLLGAIGPRLPVTPDLIEAAEVAWLEYSALEREHTNVMHVEGPSRSWFQVEIAPFPAELERVEDRFLDAVPPADPARTATSLDTPKAFPSGAALRLIEVRPVDEVENRAIAVEGTVQRVLTEDRTPPPEFQVLAEQDLVTGDRMALPWDLDELGYTRPIPIEGLRRILEAEEQYLELEREHARAEAGRDGAAVVWVVEPFQEGRAAIVERLTGWLENMQIARPDFEVLMPFGGRDEPTRIWQVAAPGGAKVSIQIDDGAWYTSPPGGAAPELVRFLQRAERAFGAFEPGLATSSERGAGTTPEALAPARLGLPDDLSEAGRAAIARASDRFHERLVLQRGNRDLRAAAGGALRAGWPRSPLPEEPPLGGVQSRVPAFAETRAALLDELFATLEAELGEVDRDRVAALVAPLGARDEIVHAGRWADHYFLVARPAGEEAGDPRVVWGGREIDPRFRAFFLDSGPIFIGGPWEDWTPEPDAELDVRALRGSRIRPAIDSVVVTDTDLVYPGAGAELLLTDHSAPPTAELVLAAEDAWDAYVRLLEEHRRLAAWSIDGEPFVQVDVAPFEDAYTAWRAATEESLTRASGANAELPALPGRYARAELHVDRDGVQRFDDASAEPVLDVLRSSLPSDDELENLLAEARPLELDLVDAVWPWRDIAPPASFTSAVLDVCERVAALESARTDVCIARLGGGVELFVEPGGEEAAALRAELAERVREAEATDRPEDARRAVDPAVLLPFAKERGVIHVGWAGEAPRILVVRVDDEELAEEAWPPGLERFLAPDLAERARLWCDPEELGFDGPLGSAAIWAVARARWAYVSQVSLRRRTIEPPRPLLPQPEGGRRQLRLEGRVTHLFEFASKRRGLLDQLLGDLRALGEEPVDEELLELTLMPFGRRPVDLAINVEDGRLTIWREVRESDALELPDEERVALVYEGPADDWRWFFWSL